MVKIPCRDGMFCRPYKTGADPGFPIGGTHFGSVDLRRGCFLVKMCVKMKELDPIGRCAPENFVCRSANVKSRALLFNSFDIGEPRAALSQRDPLLLFFAFVFVRKVPASDIGNKVGTLPLTGILDPQLFEVIN